MLSFTSKHHQRCTGETFPNVVFCVILWLFTPYGSEIHVWYNIGELTLHLCFRINFSWKMLLCMWPGDIKYWLLSTSYTLAWEEDELKNVARNMVYLVFEDTNTVNDIEFSGLHSYCLHNYFEHEKLCKFCAYIRADRCLMGPIFRLKPGIFPW